MKPTIIDIPVKMEKFYGKGKMLHPDQGRVEELIKEIPFGKITTIDELAKKMAKDVGVELTCPMRTGNNVKKTTERLAGENMNSEIPFWRVIKKDKMILKSKYDALCASNLEQEGFRLSYPKEGKIKVDVDEQDLFCFK